MACRCRRFRIYPGGGATSVYVEGLLNSAIFSVTEMCWWEGKVNLRVNAGFQVEKFLPTDVEVVSV
jgi:hypothetical protein